MPKAAGGSAGRSFCSYMRIPSWRCCAPDREALFDPAVAEGKFRILFDGDGGFSRWHEGFYTWSGAGASNTAIR